MTEQEQKELHKQQVMIKALKEEICEIVERYAKAKIEPEALVSAFMLAGMKVQNAYSMAVIASKETLKSFLEKKVDIDQILKLIKKQAKEGKDESD